MDKKSIIILIISTAIAAFIGAFVGCSIVMNKYVNPHPKHLWTVMSSDLQNTDKMAQEQQQLIDNNDKDLEDSMKHFFTKPLLSPPTIGNGVKLQDKKDKYLISIDLKPFDNNPKNVNVKIDDNKVFISAKYKSKDKNDFHSAQLQQTLILPTDINDETVKQEKIGNSWVITLPKAVEKKD